jgi:hypothetical protein
MALDRTLQLAYSNPKPGREDEYNAWYDNEHLPDVVGIPGYVSGRRYRLSDYQRPHLPASRHRYLTIYEIEGDLGEIFAAREAAMRTSTVRETSSDSVNPDYQGYTGYLWVPMAPRLTHEEATGLSADQSHARRRD